jgi:leader peptidase (prepilin peptidase)/N-methyltransferase
LEAKEVVQGVGDDMLNSIFLLILLAGYSVEDIRKKRIRTQYLLVFAALGMFLFFYDTQLDSAWDLFGGMLLGVGIILLSLLTRGSIGMGDGLILLVSGIYLGIEKNFLLFMLALFYAALCSLILLAKGRIRRKNLSAISGKHEIPFIPFLLAAYLTILIGGFLF